MTDRPSISDIERLLDQASESADREPPSHQERADAWRAALESEPATYDELMMIYERERMG